MEGQLGAHWSAAQRDWRLAWGDKQRDRKDSVFLNILIMLEEVHGQHWLTQKADYHKNPLFWGWGAGKVGVHIRWT